MGIRNWSGICLLLGGLLAMSAAGCQTNIAGQTLPSAYFLMDDVQYFPAGEEYLLPNQQRALEEYRLEQLAGEEAVGPIP